MKTKFIFPFFACLLFTLLVSNSLFAQKKSLKDTAMLPAVTVTGTRVTVNEKVWKAFQNSFKDAQDAKWYKINRDFLVKFIMEDQEQNALFNKRGAMIYNITFGTEKHLPDDIRKQVRSVYTDYNITKAISVHESDRVIWIVNLEDAKNLIVVRVEDGELEEARNFKKTT
jgi:hypothetical protein